MTIERAMDASTSKVSPARAAGPHWRKAALRHVGQAAALGLTGLAVAACTVLSSALPEQLAADHVAPTGVFYALPKGLVAVTLSVSVDKGLYFLDIGEPEYSADPQQRYLFQYRPLPNYHDVVTFEVNDRGLLSKAFATTTDETPTIIVNLAKSLTSILGYEVATAPTQAPLLTKLMVDFGRETDVARAKSWLNSSMRTHARKVADACRKDQENSAPCDAFARIAAGGGGVVLSVIPPPPMAAGAPANCSVGLCYRPKEPYVVSFGVGVTRHVKIIELPNRATPVEIDITRAFFVSKIHEISFDGDGFLNNVRIEKPSELVEVSKLPLSVIDAMGNALSVRISVVTQQTNIARKKAALLESQATLQQAKAGKEIP